MLLGVISNVRLARTCLIGTSAAFGVNDR